MKHAKRMTAMLLVLVMAVSLLPSYAHAAQLPSGTCGNNLTWILDGNILTISGTGAMDDYSPSNPAPWDEHRAIIENIILDEGVTSIGSHAFLDLERLINVRIPQSVKTVGSNAFKAPGGSLYFFGDAPAFAKDAFADFSGNCCYFRQWDQAVLQTYGGDITWRQGMVRLSPENPELYALNQPIVAEDLLFLAYPTEYDGYAYQPGTVTLGPYDNTTMGRKTVTVTADGWTFDYEYYVTDGQDHLNGITVEFDRVMEYEPGGVYPSITVKADGVVLADHEYKKAFHNNTGVGIASVTITGLKTYEGFEETYSYAIVKADLQDAEVQLKPTAFYGIPMEPEVQVYLDGIHLSQGEDYELYYENNINVGTGIVRIVGINNYCGSTTQTFEIQQEDTDMFLPGAYNGSQEDGVFNDDYAYQEVLISPGLFKGSIDSPAYHAAIYQLYRLTEDGEELITEYETQYGGWTATQFTYDFSHIYNSNSPDGIEMYMLVYSWVDEHNDVYTGVCVMGISAKVAPATSMTMLQLDQDGDFRREYLTVVGNDGALDAVQWSSSDESVATVSDGVVTLVGPGTATITAQAGTLKASCTVEGLSQNLDEAQIVDKSGLVYWNGEILLSGTDFGCIVSVYDNVKEITVTGRGLFTGQILRQFDKDGKALDHTHTFDHRQDSQCNGCDFTREITISANAGDLNDDFSVNEDDAIYLLQHILLPDFFPVAQPVDYNMDGQVNEDDAIYLLQHVLLPEFFPL